MVNDNGTAAGMWEWAGLMWSRLWVLGSLADRVGWAVSPRRPERRAVLERAAQRVGCDRLRHRLADLGLAATLTTPSNSATDH